jgi:hypothetical protein
MKPSHDKHLNAIRNLHETLYNKSWLVTISLEGVDTEPYITVHAVKHDNVEKTVPDEWEGYPVKIRYQK